MTRTREGDQPLPSEGQQNVSEAVKADLDERIRLGIQRYGKPLQTFNGRDALLDLYQELLDAVHYVKQAIMERDAATLTAYDHGFVRKLYSDNICAQCGLTLDKHIMPRPANEG